MEPLTVGAAAPVFELPATSGDTYRLSEALAASPGGVIIAFFPLAFTPG